MEEGLLSSSCSASYLSYMAQTDLPMDGIAHSGLGPPILITIFFLNNAPPSTPLEAILQLRFLLSRCVKLMVTKICCGMIFL